MRELIIVEDDAESAQRLRDSLASYNGIDELEVATCGSTAEYEALIAERGAHPDIVFICIEFEGATNGIDFVAKHFPHGCGTQVVYLASNLSHAPDAYLTEHAYLVAKPVAQSCVHDALDRALANIEERLSGPFLVRSSGTLVSLRPSQIVYVESDRRKVRVHTVKSVVECYSSLSEVARMLPSTFAQCHKSFLVNLAYVAKMGKTDIVTTTGETIPISQRRKKATVDALTKYTRKL